MNAVEMLSNTLLNLASRAAQGAAYASWRDDFARKEVAEVWQKPKCSLTITQIAEAPEADLLRLGFSRWSNDSDLLLIPLWAFNAVADGEQLTCINGETKIKGTDEIDLDVRFGCIAWGFSKPRAN
jgi:hypothetical protein